MMIAMRALEASGGRIESWPVVAQKSGVFKHLSL
jgi:hypothetical protein